MTTSDPATSSARPSTLAERWHADIVGLLKSRHTLLWVVTQEEARAESAIAEAAASLKYTPLVWDCSAGLAEAGLRGGPSVARSNNGDPAAILGVIRDSRERSVWMLRDFAPWLRDPTVLRALRNRARELKNLGNLAEARSIVIISPTAEIPPELAEAAKLVTLPLPDRAEMARVVDAFVDAIGNEDVRVKVRASFASGTLREAAIDAAVGLTRDQAEDTLAKCLATTREIRPAMISAEKRRVVAGIPGLSWIEPDPRGLDAIGGLENLKGWLVKRREAFSERARAYGVPLPRGVCLAGVPGCGKSATAKAVPTAWGVPLLRYDVGASRSKYVGESEGNLRRVLAICDAIGPHVLWLDEVEKALSGSSAEQGDGGVSADALGAILSWMQERKGGSFVVATANDVSKLPPEFLRAGRFDAVFFVDLPTRAERSAIVAASIREHRRDPDAFDLDAISKASEGFAGAEVAALMPEALITAFSDGEREPTTADLVSAAGSVVPLAKTAAEKIDTLRKWAAGRARPASLVETASGAGRAIDLE